MLTPAETAPLSCPSGERADIVSRLRANHQRDYVWGLLVRSGEELAREAPELSSLLVKSRDDPRLFTNAVPVQQAALVAAAGGAEHDASWVAAQVGLTLRHAGVLDPWRARFRTPRRLRFGDWISPPLGEIDTAHLDDVAARGWVRLPGFTVKARTVALVPAELAETCPIEVTGWKPEAAIPACSAAFVEALGVVGRHAPAYLDWIEDGVHTVVPVDSPPGVEVSGSRKNVDGVVFVGLPASTTSLGELLIHEASHQLLHLVEAAVVISNGYDSRVYYSPFARAERDIRRILVGFHAFANIAAFYMRVRGPSADKWLAQWFPALDACHRALVQSSGLTSHGRALFEPVASSIGL